MLTEYIQNAMRLAHYEIMENGRFFGTISGCKGLYAEGKTLEQYAITTNDSVRARLFSGFGITHFLAD